MSKPRIKRRHVDGILLLDKPLGMTSNSALQKVKYLFRAEKAGHSGTLDPMATGLLPICFGEATKFSSQLLNQVKTYEFICQLGIETNSGDADGEVISTLNIPLFDEKSLTETFSKFIGEIEQTPPMTSALHHNGERLYNLARQGIEVHREKRLITVYQLELLDFGQDFFKARVTVSKGTYIRVLAEDIAKKMQTVGHLTALRRVSIEPFVEPAMITLDELMNLADSNTHLDDLLMPVDEAIKDLPQLTLNEIDAKRLQQGQKIALDYNLEFEIYRIYDEAGLFLGTGERFHPHVIKPLRLCQPN